MVESRRAGEWDVESWRAGGSAWDKICIISLPACLVMPTYFCLFPFSSFSSQRLSFDCQSLARFKNPALIWQYKKVNLNHEHYPSPQSNLTWIVSLLKGFCTPLEHRSLRHPWLSFHTTNRFIPWPLTLDPWPLTLDPWPLTLDPWPLTLDPWFLTLDPWPLTLHP